MTYTFATMEVPRFVHALVRQLLLEAKYDHVVDDVAGTLDMTHIALVPGDGPDPLEEMRAAKDGAYLERNRVVAALACCFPAGIGRTAIEGWDPEWENVVYIDLPTGQVSWHFHDDHEHLFARLPKYAGTWDGHDTPEKYRRLGELRLQDVRDPLVVRMEMLATSLRVEANARPTGHTFGERAVQQRLAVLADEIDRAVIEVRLLGKSHATTAVEARAVAEHIAGLASA